MFGSRLIAPLLLAFSISGLTSAHDVQRSLADVDEIMMPSTDEYAFGERRLSWNFWSSMMFDVLGSWCAGPDGYCRIVCGPPPSYCQYYEGQSGSDSESNRGLGYTSNVDDDCDDDKYEPDYGKCEICTARPKPKPPKKPSGKSSSSSSTTDDHTEDEDCDDKVQDEQAKASGNGSQKTGMKMSNWWMFAVAAAVVAMAAAGVIMKKRRNVDEEGDSGSNGLLGAVNTRAAALLAGGAAAGAAGAAALPKFLSVPSMRRTPSGIEVDQNGGILEQSPSRYYEMEGAEDESPHGVELSRNGSTAPYMV